MARGEIRWKWSWMVIIVVSVVAGACQDDPVGDPFHQTIYRVVNLRDATIGVLVPPGVDAELVEAGAQLVLIDVGGFSNYPFTPTEAHLAVLVMDTASGDTLFLRDPTQDDDWERTDESDSRTIYELFIE